MAHQIINTGTTTMRYLALSTLVEVDACEYPDSGKVLIVAGMRGKPRLRKMVRAENTVVQPPREHLKFPEARRHSYVLSGTQISTRPVPV